MADPKNINPDPFDHPDGYFEALERNWSKSSQRLFYPMWYHSIAASLLLGLGIFALWPREQSPKELTLDELAYAELSAISEVELIYAMYEYDVEEEDDLGVYIDLVDWDTYELLWLEENVPNDRESIQEDPNLSEEFDETKV